MNKFTLLNSNGVARPGFYIEITEFPQGAEPGKAIYVDGRAEDDVINFRDNPQTELLDAWHVGSPESKFTMRPITVSGRVVGLDVQFSHIPDFTAHFALDLSTESEDIVYDILAPPVHLAEMNEVSF